MSDLKPPRAGSDAIDPESDDFVSQFDREFGAQPVSRGDRPDGDDVAERSPDDRRATGAGDADQPATPDAAHDRAVAASTGSRSWPERAVMRVIRRPYEWIKRPWPDDRVVQVAVTIACLVVTTFIMMRIVHWDPLSARADFVGDDTTPTGGDMGSHVWGPAFLRDHLLPSWQLSGWSMDWYGGLPVYRFYMVIPALAITLLDALPGVAYGVAFKYVVISGLVTLPLCCWAFGRLARFRYPMPELFAFAGLCFALNESYSIYGGNVKSTMAGEFSFSIAISLMVLGWGLLARGLDEGKFRSWAAIVLALACLSHGIVLIYTVVGALAIVICRLVADLWRARGSADPAATTVFVRRLLYSLAVGGLTFLLSAFWVGPFVFNHDYMTDMKYGFRPDGPNDSFWDMFFDQKLPFDILITSLAVAGLLFCVVRRHAYGIAIGVTGLVAVWLVYATRDSLPVIGLLWNPRVLPLVYLVRYLLMMVGVVEIAGLLVNAVRNRPAREVPGVGTSSLIFGATALVVLIIFGWVYQVLPLGGRVTTHGASTYAWGPFRSNANPGDASGDGWSRYNFMGYEGRDLYPEYHDVVQQMGAIGEERGCGRAMWEIDNRDGVGNGKYGTTMALMLLPFWTDGCIASMEGLFFEASGTTPYHFLTAGAMSRQASNPVRQLRYVNNDATEGVEYLQALGVRYVMLTTQEAVDQAATRPDELTLIAQSGPWWIYEVADSDIVVPLEVQPVVVNGRDGDQRERYLELGTSWFQNQQDWAAMPANGGPDTWQRIDVAVDPTREVPDPARPPGSENPDLSGRQVSVVEPVQEIETVVLDPVEVSNVEIGQQDVSFEVDEVGVPVLVRVSYFPNWSVEGGEGPYRIGPNQMVVVPTETTVRLSFERSTTDLFFYGLTLLGIVLAVFFRFKGDVKYPALAGAGAGARADTGAEHEGLAGSPTDPPALTADGGWSPPIGPSTPLGDTVIAGPAPPKPTHPQPAHPNEVPPGLGEPQAIDPPMAWARPPADDVSDTPLELPAPAVQDTPVDGPTDENGSDPPEHR